MRAAKYVKYAKYASDAIIRHDAKRCLRGGFGLAIISLCILLFLIPFSTAGIPGDSIFDIGVTHMQMKYRFAGAAFVPAVQVFSIVYGFVSGLMSFCFVQDPRRSSAYFVLGISREKLYLNRLLTGAGMLAVTILIPAIVSLLLNIVALGLYEGMIAAFFYLTAGLFVTAMAAFCIAALGCLLSGTMAEGVFFSAALFAIPYTISYAADALMKHLLWGDPFGAMPYLGEGPLAPFISELFAPANPALFFFEDLKLHSMFYRPIETAVPDVIEPANLVIWIFVCAILSVLGLLLMKHRHAEQAGFAGKNPFMTRICAFVPLLFVCALVFDMSAGIHLTFGLVLLCLVFAAGLFGGDRLLLPDVRRGRILANSIRLALIAAFVSFAGIGYGSYVSLPDTGDISGIRVSYAGSPNDAGVPALGSSTVSGYYFSACYTYTEEGEIALARSLHEQIAGSGWHAFAPGKDEFEDTVVPYDVQFTYELKSGKTKTWYYDRATFAQLKSMLALVDTEPVREGIGAAFSGGSDGGEMLWAQKAYADGDLYLADATYRSIFLLNLSTDDRKALLACIREDTLAQKTEDRYFPKGEPLGILMFTFDGENDLNTFSYHLNNAFVYINEGFEQTQTFLLEKDLWFGEDVRAGSSSDPDEADTLIIQRYDPYIGINKPYFPQSLYFMSYLADGSDAFRIQKDFGNADVVRDPEEVSVILSEMRSNYFLSEPGYLVAVKYKESDRWVYKFWPGGREAAGNAHE
jgi:ABC-2 type transport system permease protein